MTQAYPLQWPQGRPRKSLSTRKDATFGTMSTSSAGSWKALKKLGMPDAIRRLQDELDKIAATSVVLSTNVELRLDGFPRGDRGEPRDPGVALYFMLARAPHVMACDTFSRVADNIAALAAHIEATRKIARLGVATAAEMFAGFQALPAPGSIPWWQVLEIEPDATLARINAAYARLAKVRHPDRPGGSHDMMADLNRARDAAVKERT